jgi:hypothetical protein
MTGTTTDRPPETRLWVALQRLSRLRDEYTRDKCPAGRRATAQAIADRVAELGALADELLTDAERASSVA